MNIMEAMEQRHSVRRYLDKPITEEDVKLIKKKIEEINAKSGLTFSLITNEPKAFSGNKPHYGEFACVKNYIVSCGPKNKDEEIGYYGEELILFLQSIGINTCWVAITFNWFAVRPNKGLKLYPIISIGYGETQGIKATSKPLEKLSNLNDESPLWFKRGMEAVQLAPSTMHKQNFYFELQEDKTVKAKDIKFVCSKVDLGIAKYHFEVGAGINNFKWSK